MKVFWTLEPPQRRNLLILFGSGLLFWMSLASLLPTLPLYIQHIGGNASQIGIVMGSFAIGLLLFRPWLGRLADRRSRKLVLIVGTAVAAIAPFGYLFVQSIPMLIGIRAFHGISIAAFTTAYSALVVDLSPISKRGELIGYMSLVAPIGMALGPAIGGLLQAGAGYDRLFLFAAALGIISLVGVTQIREARKQVIGLEDNPDLSVQVAVKPLWKILTDRSLLIPSLVLLLIGFAFGALTTFVPLYITETKIDLNPGWFYTAAALASFTSRIFIGRASDVYGRGLFITASIFSYCLAMLMLSQAKSAIAFLLGGILEGAGSGTLLPMMVALLSDRSSPLERGRIFAICISGFDLGVAIAGPVFGFTIESIGYRGIFVLSTGLSILGMIVFITQCSKDLHHSLKFALGRERDLYAFGELKSEK
ncbi:MFS transporter [Argonema galeatum A003/A1]|nr:MFS transporter [Argonema galeatum]MCL1467739.1 MFS transporter [Argonema galeatum A003/A1]